MSQLSLSKLELEFLRSCVQSEIMRLASHKPNITDQKVVARLEVRNKEVLRKLDDELDEIEKSNAQQSFVR